MAPWILNKDSIESISSKDSSSKSLEKFHLPTEFFKILKRFFPKAFFYESFGHYHKDCLQMFPLKLPRGVSQQIPSRDFSENPRGVSQKIPF